MKLIIFIFVLGTYSTSGTQILNNDLESVKKQAQIFINQSDSIFILAKHGQTVSLPCLVVRKQNQELANIHVIWKKLLFQRASVLSIGSTLLSPDMRHIVKKTNKGAQPTKKDYTSRVNRRVETENEDNEEYSSENWQFEIRKLNYEDAGTYQCSLPLAQPLAKNITLQVIPDLSIEPKKATFQTSEVIKITCQATLRIPNTRRKYARKHLRQHRPFMSWYKGNEIIKADHTNSTKLKKHEIQTERFEFTFKSHLTIHDANPKDSGKYRCIFENIQEHAMISVHGSEYSHKNLQSGLILPNTCSRIISMQFAPILTTLIAYAIYFKPS